MPAGSITTPVFVPARVANVDSNSAADQNTQSAAELQNYNNCRAMIGGTDNFNDTINNIDTRVTALESAAFGYREKKTGEAGGFWGDIIWGSTTTIIIKPKYSNGNLWIGAILNDGSYLEDTTSTSITVTLDATTLDGIGAVQNNSWYYPVAYEDAVGALAFDLMFMPKTLLSASNPTNDVTLTQLNGKDIRSLYPVGAEVVIWESNTKFETPLYDTTGAAYTPTSTDMVIDSYPAANQIRLSANLTVVNFTAATAYCYLINGFQPIDCTTEAINAAIGARGWIDTGIRIRSDGSGNIVQFQMSGGYMIWVAGATASFQGYNFTASALAIDCYIPPDKTKLIVSIYNAGAYSPWWWFYYSANVNYTISVLGANGGGYQQEIDALHGIVGYGSAGVATVWTQGHKI